MTNFKKTPPPFEPGLSILIRQFIAYGVRVLLPPQVAFTPEEMEELLGRFGFHSIKTHSETNHIIYETAEDCWAFILTLPPGATMLSMSEEKRARFKDEYLAKLRAMSRQDGLHLSLGVIYTLAKR